MTATIPLYRVKFALWCIVQGYPVSSLIHGRWHSPAMSQNR